MLRPTLFAVTDWPKRLPALASLPHAAGPMGATAQSALALLVQSPGGHHRPAPVPVARLWAIPSRGLDLPASRKKTDRINVLHGLDWALPAIFDQEFEAIGHGSNTQTHPAARTGGFNPIANQAFEGRARLLGIDEDRGQIFLIEFFEPNLPLGGEFVQRQERLAGQHMRLNPLSLRACRSGELHQFGEKLVNALHLGNDFVERLLASRFSFVAQQVLGLTGNHGKRIIDFVSRSGGEFGQRFQFDARNRSVSACRPP